MMQKLENRRSISLHSFSCLRDKGLSLVLATLSELTKETERCITYEQLDMAYRD